MEYAHSKEFTRSLSTLSKKGGSFQKAAERVHMVLGQRSQGIQDPLATQQVTNNNESRIDKCVKYDLPGRSRLVTVRERGICLLLYVGSHDDADKWLERNKGKRFRADKQGRIAELPAVDDNESSPFRAAASSSLNDNLYRYLDNELFGRLKEGLRKIEVNALESLKSGDYQDLSDLCHDLPDREQQSAIRNVFLTLMRDDVSAANNLIREYVGDLREFSQIADFTNTDQFTVIPRNDKNYLQRVKRLIESDDYKSWMLFMHPDQEALAVKNFDGPAKLMGVSGSGKTCIVVRRALELAARYPEEKILVLTLNPPLASLIRDLVVQAGGSEALDRIRVDPLFELCRDLLGELEPCNTKLYDEVTWKGDEHVDEVWREYYRCELNNKDAECMLPVHDSLISRGIDAENYIREEFDWIRSAFSPDRRIDYLTAQRVGRHYVLSRAQREKLLKGLEGWEKKLKDIGVIDYLGIATATHRHITNLQPVYGAAIIDESQDFGTTELSLVRRLTKRGNDDIFLCGDAAQRVSSKFQSVKLAGIDTHPSRISKINLNYRNSRDILEAAFEVLIENTEGDVFDSADFEILFPEYADFSGPSPLILEAENLSQEIANAFAYRKELLDQNPHHKCLIVIAGYSNFEVVEYGSRHDVNVPTLQSGVTLDDSNIYLSDIEQSKGFEFDSVFIVNLQQGVFPDCKKPEEEWFRELARFYVSMTRAKKNLIISWSGARSTFLSGVEKSFLSGHWNDFLEERPEPIPVPKKLNVIRHAQQDVRPVQLQDGKQFLYQEYAVGLPAPVIEQLRKYVTGTRRVQGPENTVLEWRDLGTLYRDLQKSARARNRFGRESGAYVLTHLQDVIQNTG